MTGLAVALCLKYAVYLLIFFVIAQAVLSWVNPDSPAYPIVSVIVRPFTHPSVNGYRRWQYRSVPAHRAGRLPARADAAVYWLEPCSTS